jgi:hypothetical protein
MPADTLRVKAGDGVVRALARGLAVGVFGDGAPWAARIDDGPR